MTDDTRIDSILDDWRARRAAGEAVSIDEVITAHPELAAALRARGAALEAGAASPHPTLRNVAPERYAEFRVLGQGGMGIVYWALDTDLNRQVAFKVVRPDAGQPGSPTPTEPIELTPPTIDTPASKAFATLRARFLQEAWVTARLEHPGVVPVYEVGQTREGVPYYTMRFVRGSRTLAAAMAESNGKEVDERLSLLEPFLKVCDTIRYAHAHGVIHRDLKPDNVALGEFGEVVVLDWGIAKLRGGAEAEDDALRERLAAMRDAAGVRTSIVGTPGYMSPEAATGRGADVDARSDVYSLGAILYEILTGRLPYEFFNFLDLVAKLKSQEIQPPSARAPEVPEELSRLCMRALSWDRARRPASVDELAAAIRAWQTQRAVDSEVAAHLRDARRAIVTSESLGGDARLAQLDLAAASLSQVFARVPEHAAGRVAQADVERLRRVGLDERERAGRRRLVRRAAMAALVLLVVAAAAVAKFLDDERQATGRALVRVEEAQRRTKDALSEARRESEAKTTALRAARHAGLTSAAYEALDRDPLLALLLARAAVRVGDTPAAWNQLRRALFESRARAVFRGHSGPVKEAAFSSRGTHVLTVSDDGTARVWDDSGRRHAILTDYAAGIRAAEFSSDGTRIVTASDDATARVWDLEGRQVAVLKGHAGAVRSARFSADGTRVVTAAADGTARVWEASGKELAALTGHEGSVDAASFSPDGRRVLTASGDWTPRLWDANGKELAVLRGHGASVLSSSFSPDGTRIVTSSWDSTARVWDLSGKELAVLRGHDGRVGLAVFSPDGTRIVTACDDTSARVYDSSGKELALLSGHSGAVWSARFSPDGQRIVTACDDGLARVWDAAGRQVFVLGGQLGPIHDARFSPDGRRIVTASFDHTAMVWDVAGKELEACLGHTSWVRSAEFSPDGLWMVTSSGDHTARVWDSTGKALATLRGHGLWLWSARFSPDGTRIVTASGDGTARVWNRSGKSLAVLRGHTGRVWSARFSPDGGSIVTCCDDATARVWDLSGKERAVLRGHGDLVGAACFSPDGQRVLTGSRDGTARLWDRSGRQLALLQHGHSIGVVRGSVGVGRVPFSPDGTRMVTSSDDGTARVWDDSGREIAVLRGHTAGVGCAEFSPDGTRIVTGSGDWTARVWDASGKELAVLRGHTGGVTWADFSPDGKTVVSSSLDRTARIWDLAGNELAILAGNEGHLHRACFSPGGMKVLTCAGDGVRLWFVHNENLLHLAVQRSLRDFTDVERRRYRDLIEDR